MVGQLSEKLQRIFSKTLRGVGGDRIGVAVSGGADSVALALLAARWAREGHPQRPVPLALVVDHALRPVSFQEAKDTCTLAEKIGLHPLFISLAGKAGWPPAKHGQIYNEARVLRYSAMYEACQSHHATTLLTGHHADDQAETFLIRLSRGSGVDGLAGMELQTAPRQSTGEFGARIRTIRPLLGVRKAALYQFCRENELDWVEDATNADTAFIRNLIRKLLHNPPAVPTPRRENSASERGTSSSDSAEQTDIVEDILRVCKACSHTRQLFASKADPILEEMREEGARRLKESGYRLPKGRHPKDSMVVSLTKLQGLDQATGLRVVGKMIQNKNGSYPPSFKATYEIWKRLQQGHVRDSTDRVPTPIRLRNHTFRPVPKTLGEVVLISS